MVPSRDLYTSGALPMQPSSPPSEYFSGLVQLINFPQYRQFASLNVKYALFSARLALNGDILHRTVAADHGKIRDAALARRDFPRVGLCRFWAVISASAIRGPADSWGHRHGFLALSH
jgi:hypothetical protein